jgi:basic amino acid/polyamine antiporter, APA family
VKEIKRDAGLVRAVGTLGLTASIVNIVIGAGIFAVPAALAGAMGSYAPLAFLVCGIAIGSIAVCFAEGGSRMPTSGGAYGYIEAAFGSRTGYIAGTLLWFSDALACGGVSAALADVAVSVLPQPLKAVGRAALIIGVLGAIALVNIGGVGHGTRLINAATVLKLVPLAIFLVMGAGAMHGSNFAQTVPPTTAGFGRALILALFAFVGMEVSLSASGEIAQPSRTIPRALAIAMGSIMVIYIAIQVIAQGILGASLAQSTVPLAEGMARINPGLRVVMLAGAAFSMFGWIGSDLLGNPRILFAFARDGFLPAALGRLHSRYHTPHLAILCYAALSGVLALTGTFAELAVLSALGIAVVYILGCAAAGRLARDGVALAGAPLGFRWLKGAMVTGIGSMLVLIALASRTEIVGVIAMVGAAALIYEAVARGRARVRDGLPVAR